ncbi:hypothetical protein NE237_007536 [Protea cynaroides]|uniref:Uncharacterized protein n=1 Tax=Protea cynaroides TaxID=273540 RepID=A0A9Q0KPE0_9MAGN|nr:hypothetical protein NE237_007536 [Protea cynaroides]
MCVGERERGAVKKKVRAFDPISASVPVEPSRPLFLILDYSPALKPSCSSTPSLPSPAILAHHQVKHLRWKCKGNQKILVDGLPVEVFWDVHNWLFGIVLGSVVFMFQTCVADEKSRASHSNTHTEPLPTILPWSSSQIFRDSQWPGLGFSLIFKHRRSSPPQRVIQNTTDFAHGKEELSPYKNTKTEGQLCKSWSTGTYGKKSCFPRHLTASASTLSSSPSATPPQPGKKSTMKIKQDSSTFVDWSPAARGEGFSGVIEAKGQRIEPQGKSHALIKRTMAAVGLGVAEREVGPEDYGLPTGIIFAGNDPIGTRSNLRPVREPIMPAKTIASRSVMMVSLGRRFFDKEKQYAYAVREIGCPLPSSHVAAEGSFGYGGSGLALSVGEAVVTSWRLEWRPYDQVVNCGSSSARGGSGLVHEQEPILHVGDTVCMGFYEKGKLDAKIAAETVAGSIGTYEVLPSLLWRDYGDMFASNVPMVEGVGEQGLVGIRSRGLSNVVENNPRTHKGAARFSNSVVQRESSCFSVIREVVEFGTSRCRSLSPVDCFCLEGNRWPNLARYLGFSNEETRAIEPRRQDGKKNFLGGQVLKGLLWIDCFFCNKENMSCTWNEFNGLAYKELLWRTVPKTDKQGDELYGEAIKGKDLR